MNAPQKYKRLRAFITELSDAIHIWNNLSRCRYLDTFGICASTQMCIREYFERLALCRLVAASCELFEKLKSLCY